MMEYISIVVLALGIFLVITSVVGVMRFPDFYTKLHPAGITDSLGAPLILIGLAMRSGFSIFTIKVLLLICFLWITGTTASYALARSAYYKEKKGKDDAD
ncbi:monovalent cation/proton antiporter, MnhG/PhaG subunit [Ehrlichia chaffeensis str. Heartland]|uniref:Monovalent cation/proton antiporter, MnhG/PhaG subunit family n=1 Tax=Ehrlichia chaffeensis (strain ATCC CRL-10679 / Arkansas) TaxID=205920 RepID=Q2GGZ9_EHRCR|nr:monovalent cation/H(+) antiporter subunit G [Ehrlichia chaffeensis]ABD44531.1 monovalent cation/proton antiporter, MnhG/PhaG subunit family [Ehrlichia chaffeensis str. Arkansas]AHX03564.1 monovalent cation/proton antiporter, MnhG/PhaG subunit [Ehrlichia chaffeensis str. Heartland]AHX05715.1 monovalent cation/proton antiporter, MnhG/PhaG subunit [Ehrlichia chaffeensis str. Jax]AHX06707.1 monovalent cation/proton antiporter, MnhG/PhaG subunit [Ehrlichia chaffeensis str. Liberty]AHX07998.1 mon